MDSKLETNFEEAQRGCGSTIVEARPVVHLESGQSDCLLAIFVVGQVVHPRVRNCFFQLEALACRVIVEESFRRSPPDRISR
jgi:hypothetical protein